MAHSINDTNVNFDDTSVDFERLVWQTHHWSTRPRHLDSNASNMVERYWSILIKLIPGEDVFVCTVQGEGHGQRLVSFAVTLLQYCSVGCSLPTHTSSDQRSWRWHPIRPRMPKPGPSQQQHRFRRYSHLGRALFQLQSAVMRMSIAEIRQERRRVWTNSLRATWLKCQGLACAP